MGLWTMIFLIVVVGCVFAAVMGIVESRGRIKLEEMKAVNNRIEGINNGGSNVALLEEIRAENAELKAELGEIKRLLSSVEQMMSEIE